LPLLCGIDWTTEHHDVAVIDVDGRVVARGRVSDDAVGFAQLAKAGGRAGHLIPVGIESDCGWPRCAPRPPVVPQEIETTKPNGIRSTNFSADFIIA
jgi:hypothetical protein